MLDETETQITQAITKGAIDISYRLTLGFKVGSILYIIFDVVILMLIFQNFSRPTNKKENVFYSLVI